MKRCLKNFLWLLTLIAFASSQTPAAAAAIAYFRLATLSALPAHAATVVHPFADRWRGDVVASSPTLEISALIKEDKRGHVLLEINWYVEQENLAVSPSEVSIIAVLIGARGKEYKALANVRLKPRSALSGTTQVVINHEEQFTGPTNTRFIVTVALKRNGNAANLPSRTRAFVLRMNRTD